MLTALDFGPADPPTSQYFSKARSGVHLSVLSSDSGTLVLAVIS